MLTFLKRLASLVPTPASGKVTLFVDDAGDPVFKDDAGVVRSMVGEEGPEGPEGPQGPAGPGLPTGGTTGQVPVKASGSDYDTAWTTLTAEDVDAQPANANLTGISGLTPTADQSLYYDGSAWAAYSLTTLGRSLAGSADAEAARSSLELGTASVQNTGISGATVPLLNGGNTWSGTQTYLGTNYAGASLRLSDGTNSLRIFANSGQIYFSASASLSYRYDGNNILAGGGVAGAVQWPGIVPTSYIYPLTTNAMPCGSATNLWTQVYAANAAINTSDARLKTDPRQLRDAEFKSASAIARLPAVWRWLNRVHGDENCEPEGMEARKHFGPTVQAAIAVMEAHGLDPFAYSFICYDQWEAQPEQWHDWPNELDDDGNVIREAGRELLQPARAAGDRYSFRKEELLCFLASAMAVEIDQLRDALAAQAVELASALEMVQQLMERVTALEAKLTP